MKINLDNYKVYAVTDSRWLKEGETLAMQVEKAILGGAGIVQIREKELDDEAFLALALEVKKVCNQYQVPLIINDNVKVAVEADADGVHVGQSDLDAEDVRALLGQGKIIGVSAHSIEEARIAKAKGADYLGVGAAFATGSKGDVNVIDHKVYKEITDEIDLPVVAIGGINKDNVSAFAGSGINGVAVISAIFAQEDITAATAELKKLVSQIVG